MTERELQRRLRAAAVALDADAPLFEPAILRRADRRRARRGVIALAAVIAVIAAPVAVSALGDLFRVDEVQELASEPGVAGPFLGGQPPLDEAQARDASPFPLRTISSLGSARAAYVREDVTGGMVSLRYDGDLLLTQWPADAVDARVAIVPVRGTAEELEAGGLRLLWIAGAARGTFTLIGADGTEHREAFDVEDGALLWREGGLAFLLQGAGEKETAVRLASAVR